MLYLINVGEPFAYTAGGPMWFATQLMNHKEKIIKG
jgi:hypothetical protein